MIRNYSSLLTYLINQLYLLSPGQEAAAEPEAAVRLQAEEKNYNQAGKG